MKSMEVAKVEKMSEQETFDILDTDNFESTRFEKYAFSIFLWKNQLFDV
jgi:hypothetical protein